MTYTSTSFRICSTVFWFVTSMTTKESRIYIRTCVSYQGILVNNNQTVEYRKVPSRAVAVHTGKRRTVGTIKLVRFSYGRTMYKLLIFYSAVSRSDVETCDACLCQHCLKKQLSFKAAGLMNTIRCFALFI